MNQASQDLMKKTSLVFLLFFGLLSLAQTNPSATPSTQPQSQTAPTPQQPPSPPAAQAPEKPPLAPKHIDAEDPQKADLQKGHKITAVEAKELFQSVDEI